ncbi:acyl carrier protein [Micromonospora sp. NPDC005220]|uniref:acyl carrier protein n=1 Tax=Micromonospora sp. NPDC005220 TaxID=3155589 RepID=UPI0033A71288
MSITVQDVVDLISAKLGGRAGPTVDGQSVLRDLGLSSLEIADMVYSLEDQLGVEFDPAEAADVLTVADLVQLANAAALTSTES